MTNHGDDSKDPLGISRLTTCASLPESRRLLHLIQTRKLKIIAIHSQFRGEGKTFVTAMLAESAWRFAERRVLIIDAVSSNRGQSSFKYPVPLTTQKPKIDVILAKNIRADGHLSSTMPSEQESNESHHVTASDFDIGEYLGAVRDTYDLILIDCCPLTSITSEDLHPAIISWHSDACIVVTAPRSLRQGDLVSLKALLKHHNLVPLGVVFNAGGQQ